MLLSRRTLLTAATAGAIAAGIRAASAAGRSAEPAWSFAVVADPHLQEDRKGEPTGVEKFQRVLASLEALQPQPELMLLLGDLHVEKLVPLLPQIPIPVHVVMGNHEGTEPRKLLRERFAPDFGGKDYYTFVHRESLFIGLCTAAPTDHVGHFESEFITPGVGQCAWLEAQLRSRRRYRHCFVFGHIPPERHCRPNGMCLTQNDSRFLHDVVRQHRPTALFFGHLHAEASFDIAGIPLFGVRSCNWNFNQEPTGFLHVLVGRGAPQARFIETGRG